MRQSAIMVVVPAAEPVVGHFRDRHDPSAAVGVPAHITLLYPFVPPERIDQRVLDGLASIAAGVRAFDFELASLARFEPSVLYLAPVPPDGFVQLTKDLVAHYGLQPYGGVYGTIIPHLTVADGAEPDVMDDIARQITPRLPIRATVEALTLMEQRVDGRWETRSVVTLSGRTESA